MQISSLLGAGLGLSMQGCVSVTDPVGVEYVNPVESIHCVLLLPKEAADVQKYEHSHRLRTRRRFLGKSLYRLPLSGER
jgi:hypothetical protein